MLDVREPDEYEQGAIPGAVHIPRGTLESSVENRIADKSAPVDHPLRQRRALGVRGQDARRDGLRRTSSRWSAASTSGRTRAATGPRPASSRPEQRNRYQRHLLLPEVDVEGQLKLLDAKVLLLGAGGLGSPAALYLAAAGVGTIGIVDMDVVDESNLQRQILHNIDRIGERKVDSAKKTLTAINPDVNVVTHDVRLGADNVIDILSGYDVVVDGADNFPVRYLLNDAALKLGIPVVHGSIFRFEGQATVFKPHDGPCYRCFLPEPPPPELAPSCAEAGVLGVLPGIVGSIQAVEAIKLILGIGDSLSGRLLAYDSLEQSFRTFKMLPRPAVPGVLDRPGRHRHRRVRRALHAAPDRTARELTGSAARAVAGRGVFFASRPDSRQT